MTELKDNYTKVSIEDMIDLIRDGETCEVLYEEAPYPYPNVITLICEDKYCEDVREIKTIVSAHSPTQVQIRSQNKDSVITSWKEFYVKSTKIYFTFKVDHTIGLIQTEDIVNELEKVN